MINDSIRERLKVENIIERNRKARLVWFGHVKRRDKQYVETKILEVVPPERRRRGRPKQRWTDCVKRDMREREMSGQQNMKSIAELVGVELCLPQRPHKWERLEEEEEDSDSHVHAYHSLLFM